MTDLHEIAKEQRWSPQEAAVMLELYQRDKLGAIPSVQMCFIDPSATVGVGTKVWHYSCVLADVVLGDSVNIGSGCEIGRGSTIGNRTRIGAHVFLPPNSTVGADVFIGPGVICTDDKHPRCGNSDYIAEPPIIEDGASVGAGAVLLPGVRIGRNARVAAGSLVTKDVPDDGHVLGFPARTRTMPARWVADVA
jgi:acetyltransferase-like isoleucine patch superfamily enzyme